MKRTILGLFVFCTFSYTLQITKVQAAGGYLIKVIESLSAGTDAQMICKEQQDSSSADAFNVYSANGRMCSVPLAGAFAEVVCPGVDADYNSSTCHQISMAILHTQDPKMALQEQIGKLLAYNKGYLANLRIDSLKCVCGIKKCIIYIN